MERSTIFNGKIHYKWPFSIAMLNYQRVPNCSLRYPTCSKHLKPQTVCRRHRKQKLEASDIAPWDHELPLQQGDAPHSTHEPLPVGKIGKISRRLGVKNWQTPSVHFFAKDGNLVMYFLGKAFGVWKSLSPSAISPLTPCCRTFSCGQETLSRSFFYWAETHGT